MTAKAANKLFRLGISSLLSTVPVIVSTLAFSSPAHARFQVCNQTDATIWVAYGRYGTTSFGSDGMAGVTSPGRAEGWWKVENGGCRTIYEQNARGATLIHAVDEAGQVWGDDKAVCVDPNNRFTLKLMGPQLCREPLRIEYFNLVRSNSPNVTYTIQPSSLDQGLSKPNPNEITGVSLAPFSSSDCEKLFSSGQTLIAPHTDQAGTTWSGEIAMSSNFNGNFIDGLNSANITVKLNPSNRNSFTFVRAGQTWQGHCDQLSATGTWFNDFNDGRGTFRITPK